MFIVTLENVDRFSLFSILHSELNCRKCWNNSYHLASNTMSHYLDLYNLSFIDVLLAKIICTASGVNFGLGYIFLCDKFLFTFTTLLMSLTSAWYFATMHAKCFAMCHRYIY